jgi:hypothetical protein
MATTYHLFAQDFNKDGNIDLAVTDYNYPSNTGKVWIAGNNGTGTFTLSSQVNVGYNPTDLIGGDFDADGSIDLAVANVTSNNVSILQNNGSGTFSQTDLVGIRGQARGLAMADIDGDGTLDLFVASPDSHSVTILENILPTTYSLKTGWNMVSIPHKVSNSSVEKLFPFAESKAFAYANSYTQCDTLINGNGYWVKFPEDTSIKMSGGLILSDTITVNQGWNMIGSISEPIATSSITSEPPGIVTSDFFGYTSSYVSSDTIYPGKGYWSKVSQAGKLILSSTPDIALLSKNAIHIVPTKELPPRPPFENTEEKLIPKQYSLEQAYPNPFNPTTTIKYSLPVDSRVILKVYNTLGQVVNVLANEVQSAGYKSVNWVASEVASGVYFYKLEAVSVSDPNNSFTQVKKMVLVR